MKKVLGLDLSSNSIGWALINEPETKEEQYQILNMGVRIVPLSKDENDEFSKGNAISKNTNRTLKRSARRGIHRYKMRKKDLLKVLKDIEMMPGEELFKLPALDLYGLRNKGVKEQISLQELGRVLFHINQKRGYKSNRKAYNEEEPENDTSKKEDISIGSTTNKVNKKGYFDLIEDRECMVEKENLTIGQYFYKELCKNNFFRIKENIFMRSSYEKEFELIWEFQQQYYPGVLTNELKNKIGKEIIFYVRPLKSKKGLVSICEFEGRYFKDKKSGFIKEVFSGPKVSPKSSPLFQVSKIFQEINNIEITNLKARYGRRGTEEKLETSFDENGKRKLTLKEKHDLFAKLNWGEKLTPTQVLITLGYKSGYNDYKINLRNKNFIEGNRTLSAIKKVFDRHNTNYDHLLKFHLLSIDDGRKDKETGEIFPQIMGKENKRKYLKTKADQSFEEEPLYKLWHLLYSADEAETLEKTLISKYSFSKELAKDLTKIDFNKSGYGNISSRALRNILPHLLLGKDYTDSCELAGYKHSKSITKEENESRILKDKLELLPKNSLCQPVVEKIINQVINIINEFIDEKNGFVTKNERNAKDKFEIHVELARNLKQSAGERNSTFKHNNEEDKKHKAIVKELLPLLGSVSKRDVERYKLWNEFGKVSPYEPGKAISLMELFNKKDGVLYDIEHIIPKSRIFDDSFSNKTICPRKMNSGIDGKNQDTAYDYMKKQGENKFIEYITFIKHHLYKNNGISKAKYNKLMMAQDKIPDDFINGQIQETRYISREVRGILEQVCKNVYASTGSVTSKLRTLWGWDDILMNLQIEKYKSIGRTFIKEYISNGQRHETERIVGWRRRDDHRHHALEALIVACTKQGFIQRINHLNSQDSRDEMFEELRGIEYREKLSLLEKHLLSKKPFNVKEVEKEVSKILTSFKAGKRVAVKSKNRIKTKSGPIQQVTLTPRNFFHKETMYGQITQLEKVKLDTRFNQVNNIANESIKRQVTEHLDKFKRDPKIAFGKKELLKFIDQYKYEEVPIFKSEYVVKYKLNGDFKEKDIEFIVDAGIKKIVKSHLEMHGNNTKIAFTSQNPVWMNKEKGVMVKSVRCKTGIKDLLPLHQNSMGREIDFVSTRNNHHIAIYRDGDGNLHENTVSFWQAFERKKSGFPVVIKNPKNIWDNILESNLDKQSILENLPNEDWEYITSMQQNEMFVFGLPIEDLRIAIEKESSALISSHLYRVQKIAERYYNFRYHIETKVDDKFDGVKNEALAIKTGKMIRVVSLQNMTGIKVKINKLGQITLAEDEKFLQLSSKKDT